MLSDYLSSEAMTTHPTPSVLAPVKCYAFEYLYRQSIATNFISLKMKMNNN